MPFLGNYADVDIDGLTAIDSVNSADTVPVDDGDTGTNRKATMSQVKDFILSSPVNTQATTDTATLGSELVTNGAFSADSDWTKGTNWAIAAGVATLTLDGATEGALAQDISVTSGSKYVVQWKQTNSEVNNATITPSIGASSGLAFSAMDTNVVTVQQIITAAATGAVSLAFTPSDGSSGTIVIDDVSVKEITPIPALLCLLDSDGNIETEIRCVEAGGANLSFGLYALQCCTTGIGNIALGQGVLQNATTGQYNIGLGQNSLNKLTVGSYNSGFGYSTLLNNLTGISNIAFGHNALYANTSGNYNSAFGYQALFGNTTGSQNGAFGYSCLYANTIGVGNFAFGHVALALNQGNYCTAIGHSSGRYTIAGGDLTDYDNITCLGYDSRASGDNQVQLGNSSTTTYAYGAVQDRSDERDKADIEDTDLGLEFIEALRPRQFRWDYREDYLESVENEETGEKELVEIPRDGSKKRNRMHQGLIAQEVKEVMDDLGVDFGGYQDHAINEGCDVLSLGYQEFIAPLIKAIQELSARVKDLEARG